MGNRDKCIFSLALEAGVRIGKFLRLKWSDINFENKELKISRSIKCFDKNSDAKTKIIEQLLKIKHSIRTISLLEVIVNELKRHKNIISKEKIKGEWRIQLIYIYIYTYVLSREKVMGVDVLSKLL